MRRCSEAELRRIFSRYGTVQTCIVNKDKRHAFVKMLTRKDALKAKENMEDNRTIDLPLRVRKATHKYNCITSSLVNLIY